MDALGKLAAEDLELLLVLEPERALGRIVELNSESRYRNSLHVIKVLVGFARCARSSGTKTGTDKIAAWPEGSRFVSRESRFILFDGDHGHREALFRSDEKQGTMMGAGEERVGFGLNSGVLWGFVCVLGGLVSGCKHEPPEAPAEAIVDLGGGGGWEEPVACDSNTVWFQQQVLPILISNCAVPGCHNTATDDNDRIEITSYATLMASGIVQDGDLMDAITTTDPDDRMPKPPQNGLEPWQINLIAAWVQQGAQNNSCESAACDTANVTYSGTIRPLVQLRCQGCHSGATPQGGLDFSTWGPLNMVAMDGRLAGSIQHQPTFTAMPPSGPQLNDCRMAQFLDWIDQGAPNN